MKKWPTVEQHARTIACRDGGWRCHYCGAALCPPGSGAPIGYSVTVGGYRYCEFYQPAHVDHKTPKTRGGTHDLDNLVLSCMTCNARKGNREYHAFITIMANWLQSYGHAIPHMPVLYES